MDDSLSSSIRYSWVHGTFEKKCSFYFIFNRLLDLNVCPFGCTIIAGSGKVGSLNI